MKVYLSGPMTGRPYFNFHAFNAAEDHLAALGHEVFNPAREATKVYGEQLYLSNPFGDPILAQRHFRFSLRSALRRDLEWICQEADAIALMPGWGHSASARGEHAVAMALRLTPIYLLEAHCTPLARAPSPIPDASASR